MHIKKGPKSSAKIAFKKGNTLLIKDYNFVCCEQFKKRTAKTPSQDTSVLNKLFREPTAKVRLVLNYCSV